MWRVHGSELEKGKFVSFPGEFSHCCQCPQTRLPSADSGVKLFGEKCYFHYESSMGLPKGPVASFLSVKRWKGHEESGRARVGAARRAS